ncbi:hypothetical protein CEXT_581901 [Caerostris extrusa]|uniref:Uncharacterized protein n=1 Tax=Caerostris extrusa TaxID=172846 RepID=A0AAV4R4C7_CAEEX|nr:hypothetical protein CEXT_581901 [Caerostris extrusa]
MRDRERQEVTDYGLHHDVRFLPAGGEHGSRRLTSPMPLTRKVTPSVRNYNEGSSPPMAKITGHVRLPSTPNDESCQSSGHRTALKPRRLLM